MPVVKIPTVFNIDLEYQVADFGRRMVAYLIDLAIRAAWVILMMLVILRYLQPDGEDVVLSIFVYLPVVFYYLVSEVIMRGQSLGKKVMGLKVVSLSGSTPTLSQILLRWMFRLIESPILSMLLLAQAMTDFSVPGMLISLGIALLPLIVIMRSPLSQRLGDITANTIIIYDREKTSIDDTIFREITDTNYVPQFSQVLRLSDRDLGKIKSVLDNARRNKKSDMPLRVAHRVKEVLQIETDMEAVEFLETLLKDYNYLVQRG